MDLFKARQQDEYDDATSISCDGVFLPSWRMGTLRLYPHAQTEKKGTLFASSGAGQTSAQLLHRNASSRSNYFGADLRPRLVLESNQGELLSVVFNAVSEAEKVGGVNPAGLVDPPPHPETAEAAIACLLQLEVACLPQRLPSALVPKNKSERRCRGK
jgi:hypothetical protein